MKQIVAKVYTVLISIVALILLTNTLISARDDSSKDLSTVSTSDTLTSTWWNNLVSRITHIYRDDTNSVLQAEGWVQLPSYTTATLPTCNSDIAGTMVYDTDQTKTLVCDGTDWENISTWWWANIRCRSCWRYWGGCGQRCVPGTACTSVVIESDVNWLEWHYTYTYDWSYNIKCEALYSNNRHIVKTCACEPF